MIQAPSVANALVLAGLLLLAIMPCYGHAAKPGTQQETAAQIDWVPAARLTPAERAKLPWYCSGEYREPPPATGIPKGYIRATADKSDYVAGKDTELFGHVRIEQGYRKIFSPHVKLNSDRHFATVDGPLVIREKGLTLTGSHATSNLENGSGVVDHATFLLHLPKLRGRAKRVKRLKSTNMIITDGTFTRCEPGSDVWAMHGTHILLDPRTGFGTGYNVTIDIKHIPVVYVPWIRFPIDNRRHTGFLMPSLGYEHVGGTDIGLPIYFNLAPQYDLTWEPRSLWKRGLINSVQFRFLAGASTNAINAAYIARDKLYNPNEILNETSGKASTLPFKKTDRWFLNINHTGGWSSRWKSTVDYSAVSDISYLHDIGSNVVSTSVQQFVNGVDQTLTNNRSAALNRLGEISYHGTDWTSNLKLQGFQSLVANAAKQYELLPQFNSDYSNQFGPVNTDVMFQYTNFGKDTTGLSGPLAILGQREVMDAAVSIRKSTVWGYIRPKLDIVQRNYQLRNTPTGYATHPSLTTPRVSIRAGIYLDRFFRFRGHRLQQSLEPEVYYLYVPSQYQDHLPQFDASRLTPGFDQLFRENRFNGWDRIGDTRQVSVGLTTRILDQNTGTQFLRASLGQIYYLKDRKVIFQPSPVYDPTAPRSPLFGQLHFSLPSGLDVNGTYEWDPAVNRTNRAEFSLQYRSGSRRIFNLSYIYANPQVQPVGQFQPTKQSDVSFVWPIAHRWSVIGKWNFGWDLNQTIESIVGIEYNDCCWMSRLVIRHFLNQPKTVTILQNDPTSSTGYRSVTSTIVPHETGIFFEFQLKGLATLGQRVDSLLEEAIPGYRAREEKIGN